MSEVCRTCDGEGVVIWTHPAVADIVIATKPAEVGEYIPCPACQPKAEPKPQFDKEGWPTDITPTELTYYHRSGKSLPVAFRLACDKLARDAEIARLKAKLEKAEEIIMLAS